MIRTDGRRTIANPDPPREPEDCHPDCEECATGGCLWGEMAATLISDDPALD